MFWLKFFFDLKFFYCLTTINTNYLSQRKTQDKLVFQTKENYNLHVYIYI